MAYCSQITDLLIVMSIYSHLFSTSHFGREERAERTGGRKSYIFKIILTYQN